MSGITGIIGSRVLDPGSPAQVDAMARLLQAGSPDRPAVDHIRAERLRAHIACTRRDYEAECVRWNERRDIGIVLTGDVVDFHFSTPRGTNGAHELDRLIELYEQSALHFVSELEGHFAGVVLDLRNNRVILFNDRYGLNRIYYHFSADGFFFSSEAKSLLKVLPAAREIDQRGLAEFFSIGCVLQNRSLFKDIALLPPASTWTFQPNGSVAKHRYFDPSTWEAQPALSAEKYTAGLIDIFRRIAPKYLQAQAPVGMSLTGGLDSRMVLAWAGRPANGLPCYTFSGPFRECADVRIARRLAKISEHSHQALRISGDFFRQFGDLAEQTVSSTDGAMDVSGAVEIYANRLARQIAPFRLTGNYGSEILRANVAFRPGRLDDSLFTPEFRQLLKVAAETYREEAHINRLTFIAFKQVPWHHHARFAAEKSQLIPRSPFLNNELVAWAFRAPPELATSAGPLLQLISAGDPRLATLGTDRALRSKSTPVLGRLARSYQEFTAKAEYAYDYGMPGWLARTDRLLKPLHLERLFLGRHKFYHFRVWYRDQLGAVLRERALDNGHRPACYAEGVPQRIVSEHISGRANRTLELHKLLTVQLIERLLRQSSCLN